METHLRLRYYQRELQRHNDHLAGLVQEKVSEISQAQLAAILAVSKLAESRDDAIGRHIERVQTLCRELALALRKEDRFQASIDETYVENLYHASPLHDIGKVGIPDAILLKPDQLNNDEMDVMKTHTMIGWNTLQTVRTQYPGNGFVNMGIVITRSHHERWDGSGYPDALSGEEIPLCARIMAVADVYDALHSERCYKQGFSHDKTSAIMHDGSGTHFDPQIIEAFSTIESSFNDIHERLSA